MLSSTCFCFWVGRLGDHDKCHNEDRHGVITWVACTVDKPLTVELSGDGALVDFLGEHVKHVALVKLP